MNPWLQRRRSALIWRGARVACAVGLAALLIRGARDAPGPDPVTIVADVPTDSAARVLARTPDAPVILAGPDPPGAGVVRLLADAAEGRPVLVRPPGRSPPLVVRPPRTPVAMRRAALTVTVRGAPGETVPVVVEDGHRLADTAFVQIGEDAVTTFAFAVLPTRPGPVAWTVRASGEAVRVATWVRPERPVRTLVLTGPPTWESRFLVRALEAAGGQVVVRQELGRGLLVRSDAISPPPDRGGVATRGEAGSVADELDAFDVVALLGDGGDDGLARGLETWVRERGGGLLVAAGAAGAAAADATPSVAAAVARWSAAGAPIQVDARDLTWSGPAELVPLPAADLVVPAAPVGVPTGALPVASASGPADGARRTVVSAGWWGRGRVLATGLETWRWRMEAGLVDEHREFWASAAAWLAGGLRDDWMLPATPGVAGVAWEGEASGAVPGELALTRPGGTLGAERLRVGASGHVRFLPDAAGGYALTPDSTRGVVVHARDTPVGWTEAALAIGAAGGEVRVSGAGPIPGEGPATPLVPWLAFLLLAAAAGAGWVARRVSGLA